MFKRVVLLETTQSPAGATKLPAQGKPAEPKPPVNEGRSNVGSMWW
jgi:hypothetical protein